MKDRPEALKARNTRNNPVRIRAMKLAGRAAGLSRNLTQDEWLGREGAEIRLTKTDRTGWLKKAREGREQPAAPQDWLSALRGGTKGKSRVKRYYQPARPGPKTDGRERELVTLALLQERASELQWEDRAAYAGGDFRGYDGAILRKVVDAKSGFTMTKFQFEEMKRLHEDGVEWYIVIDAEHGMLVTPECQFEPISYSVHRAA